MSVDSPGTDQTGVAPIDRTRTMRVPRTRGAVSGLLLIVLGAWGALAPFIGPYFDFSFRTDQTWVWTAGRGWLEVLPGVAAAVGGWFLLVSKNRLRGSVGGWLAAAAGAWFVIGRSLSSLTHLGDVGQPLSTRPAGRAAAELAYFYGLGVLILFLAAFALGRLAVVGVRDVLAAQRDEERAAEAARLAEIERQRVLDEELRSRQLAEREAAERRTAEQGAAAPVVAERGPAERGVAEPGVVEPGATDRVVTDRGVTEPGVTDRGATDRGVTDRGVTDRSTAAPVAGTDRPNERADLGRAERTDLGGTGRTELGPDGRYDPNDGRTDGFGHAPAHSAEQAPDSIDERNPYDQHS